MKLIRSSKPGWGMAMSEYLIILGLAAIATIAIVGLFGQQIKSVFTRGNGALAGQTLGAATSIVSASQSATTTDDMGTFTSGSSGGSGTGGGTAAGGGGPVASDPPVAKGHPVWPTGFGGSGWYTMTPGPSGMPPVMHLVPFGTPGASYYDSTPELFP
ncbi:MAG TPA: hypothetical protein VIK53_03570 [Verrucomicrobiae bacterium]